MTSSAEKFNAAPLIALARAAMIVIARRRALVDAPVTMEAEERLRAVSVSALDLREYLRGVGYAGDSRWSGATFTAPRGLWRRVGYVRNPERHDAPTACFVVNESRAAELGL